MVDDRRQDLIEPGWLAGAYLQRMHAFISSLPDGKIVEVDTGHGIPVEDPGGDRARSAHAHRTWLTMSKTSRRRLASGGHGNRGGFSQSPSHRHVRGEAVDALSDEVAPDAVALLGGSQVLGRVRRASRSLFDRASSHPRCPRGTVRRQEAMRCTGRATVTRTCLARPPSTWLGEVADLLGVTHCLGPDGSFCRRRGWSARDEMTHPQVEPWSVSPHRRPAPTVVRALPAPRAHRQVCPRRSGLPSVSSDASRTSGLGRGGSWPAECVRDGGEKVDVPVNGVQATAHGHD